MLQKGTILPCEKAPILFQFSYPVFLRISVARIYHEGVSSAINIQEKHSSAINGLVHVSQLRIHLVHEAHGRCLQRAMDININTLPRVLFLA